MSATRKQSSSTKTISEVRLRLYNSLTKTKVVGIITRSMNLFTSRLGNFYTKKWK